MIATSPSQVKKFSPRDGCPRAWALHYLAGIKEPFEHKEAAEFGNRLHTVSENYLQHGIKPDPADEAALRFMPGMRFLPAPGSGGAEAEYTATISKIEYGLTIDFIGPSACLPVYPDKIKRFDISELAAAVELARAAGYPVVIDHKSTKAPRKVYKNKRQGLHTREDFLTDEQALIEAAVALITTKATHVLLVWVYYATEGDPYSEPRGCIVSREEVSKAFAEWVHPFARYQAVLRERSAELPDKPARVRLALSLPAVPSRCDKYKSRSPDPERQRLAPGCFYKTLCTDVSDSDRAFGILQTEEDKMAEIRDLLAELEAEEAAGGGPDVINGKRSVRKDEPEEAEEEAPPPPPKKPAPAPAPAPAKPAAGATKTKTRDLAAEIEAEEPPADKRPTKAPPAKAGPDDGADKPDQLTMRDLFATSALQTSASLLGPQASLDKIAKCAYAVADEMLKARG